MPAAIPIDSFGAPRWLDVVRRRRLHSFPVSPVHRAHTVPGTHTSRPRSPERTSDRFMSILTLRKSSLAFFLVAFVILAGCGDNPADHDDDHEEHAEAEGIQILNGSTVLYQVLEGEVTCDAAPCGVSVAAGQSLSGLEVAFIDHDGDEIHAEDLDDEFDLSFSVVNTATAVVEQNGRFGINVRGVAAGTTRMQVQLNHNGHADLTSPPVSDSNAILITVTQ